MLAIKIWAVVIAIVCFLFSPQHASAETTRYFPAGHKAKIRDQVFSFLMGLGKPKLQGLQSKQIHIRTQLIKVPKHPQLEFFSTVFRINEKLVDLDYSVPKNTRPTSSLVLSKKQAVHFEVQLPNNQGVLQGKAEARTHLDHDGQPQVRVKAMRLTSVPVSLGDKPYEVLSQERKNSILRAIVENFFQFKTMPMVVDP